MLQNPAPYDATAGFNPATMSTGQNVQTFAGAPNGMQQPTSSNAVPPSNMLPGMMPGMPGAMNQTWMPSGDKMTLPPNPLAGPTAAPGIAPQQSQQIAAIVKALSGGQI